jgi:deazaflavin-dependent oxidoreductase (nitroreductase family)
VKRFDAHGPVGRLFQKVAAHPRTSPVTAAVMPRVDRAVGRLTGGRFVLSSLLVPTLVLTTTGAKSGLPRTSPLACLPDDDGFYVVGSNFGGGTHPGWSANLIAHPQATVVYGGRTVEVVAHLLTQQEKEQVWPRLRAVWPSYDDYVVRSGRDLRVFRLAPQA